MARWATAHWGPEDQYSKPCPQWMQCECVAGICPSIPAVYSGTICSLDSLSWALSIVAGQPWSPDWRERTLLEERWVLDMQGDGCSLIEFPAADKSRKLKTLSVAWERWIATGSPCPQRDACRCVPQSLQCCRRRHSRRNTKQHRQISCQLWLLMQTWWRKRSVGLWGRNTTCCQGRRSWCWQMVPGEQPVVGRWSEGTLDTFDSSLICINHAFSSSISRRWWYKLVQSPERNIHRG